MAGMAWHYKQYEQEQSPQDTTNYGYAEVGARDRRAGLWLDGAPVPLWGFRKR